MKPVYRDYDQAGLDAEYNLRARFPVFADFVAAWERDSARARKGLKGALDIAYGPTAGERLDWFPAAGTGRRAPVMVFIHGGYWQGLDKAHMSFLAPAFVRAGLHFVAVNYALAPMVGLDEIVRQVRAALAWVWREAPRFGGDPAAIAVSGHSAGGHLTAMALATEWGRQGGLPADLVKAGVAISGIYDLEPIRLCYHNAVLGLDRGAAARNSPLHLAPAGGRLWLTVGADEPDEFLRQQAAFAAAWGGRMPVTVVPAPGLHHFDILAKAADPAHPVGQAMLAALRPPPVPV